MKRILAVILIIAMAFGITGCAPAKTQMELLEKVETALDKYAKTDEDTDMVEILLGASDKYEELALDFNTVKEYISTHSGKDFLDLLIRLSSFADSMNIKGGNISDLYEYFIKVEVKNVINLNHSTVKGNSGRYYVENPTAEPQPYIGDEEVGGFNDASNYNEVYYESRQDSQTVKYYGDFAIATKVNWIYDKGRYEWFNGKFYDEPATWKRDVDEKVWYKGVELCYSDELNYGDIYLYDTDDTLYIIDGLNIEKIDLPAIN